FHAQKAAPNGGIPAYYHLRHGYSASYPETSGYLIPSLLNSYEAFPQLKEKIDLSKVVAWLLSIQTQSGGWGHLDDYFDPMVFDTAQIVQGLLSYYRRNPVPELKKSILAACDWILTTQLPSGEWQERAVVKEPYCYLSRVSSILAETGLHFERPVYTAAAIRSCEAYLRRQQPNGWFEKSVGVVSEREPVTHFVAYIIEGMLQTGLLMRDQRFIESAALSMRHVNAAFNRRGHLPVTLDGEWNGSGKSTCLTGLAQFAMINLMLYGKAGGEELKTTALRMNGVVKAAVLTQDSDVAIRGGVQSCFPFSRKYYNLCYLNWAAKFFLDALLLENGRPLT
ncbi:MAG: terpene cyclase/mutase family protein, partial [Deltaproteobacteria bacterium]|nr:terpene cyclase/mutase family protein [Deltaproteobacteria bacterium]